MLRKTFTALTLALLPLATACSSGGGSGGGSTVPDSVLFPSFLAEDFDTLDSGRWRIERDDDVENPDLENGRLQFRWDGAALGSRVRMVLRREGIYDAAPRLSNHENEHIQIQIKEKKQFHKNLHN